MQLRQSLEAAIRAGQLVDGEALPPERDIAEYANISRVTVRKAVDDLVKAGLLVRRHGSGTFVVRPSERVQQSLSMLTSFTEDMARRGITTQSKWLERGLYYPSPEEMMKLGVSSETRVARLGRLRMASDLPLAIERASLSSEILPDPDAVKGSLYAELSRNGFRPVRAVQRIAACNIRTRMHAFSASRRETPGCPSSGFPICPPAAWSNLQNHSIAAMPMISWRS